MSNKQIHLLFLASLIGIFLTYALFLNKITAIGLIIDELLFIGILVVTILFSLYYKRGLKGHSIVDLKKDSSMSFKNIVLFFLLFQIIDYVYEGGFKGMISMWLSYWVFGYLIFIGLNIYNYYKNYKLIKSEDIHGQ